MANITEVSQWENVIRQIENGEAATGGADGLANVQAKQLANRTKWLKENYLPLTGGAVSGAIRQKVDNACLVLCGGSQEQTGANMVIYGNNDKVNPGYFYVKTGYTDGKHCELVAKPNGNLTWNNTDLAGSGIVAKSLTGTGGYIKYASGLVIQFGNRSNVPSTETVITYPISMPAFQSISIEQIDDSLIGGKLIACGKFNASGFTVKSVQGGASSIRWLAIGY